MALYHIQQNIVHFPISQEENMEIDQKTPVQQAAVEDVEDQDAESLSAEDKQVMAQMGKRQQLKVRVTLLASNLRSYLVISISTL